MFSIVQRFAAGGLLITTNKMSGVWVHTLLGSLSRAALLEASEPIYVSPTLCFYHVCTSKRGEMSQTNIFVSSTCYDLIHIRQALNAHITEMGHLAITSEFRSFQIDPQSNNVENCRRNVREHADVFLLIIGGRRGSVVHSTGKSIVNLEYEAAVDEGLDIYVFVDQSVLAVLPIWQKNKSADLQPAVDSNDVFVFLDRIRSEQRWTFPFTK
jgi:hypothetical protein